MCTEHEVVDPLRRRPVGSTRRRMALEGEWSTALGAERFRTLRSLLVDLNAIVDDS